MFGHLQWVSVVLVGLLHTRSACGDCMSSAGVGGMSSQP